MSLLPPAIELAFATYTDQRSTTHAMRVWEAFRRHRPLGDTSVARYEQLGCVALLHGVIEHGHLSEAALAARLDPAVAADVARLDHSADPDLQLITLLDHYDDFLTALPDGPWAEEAAWLEREGLAIAQRWPDLARELRFHLDDARRGGT